MNLLYFLKSFMYISKKYYGCICILLAGKGSILAGEGDRHWFTTILM